MSEQPGTSRASYAVTFKARIGWGSRVGEWLRFTTFVSALSKDAAITEARERLEEIYGERRYVFVSAKAQP